MKIAHLAIWTEHLEALCNFYAKYFEASFGEKYVNPAKGFESYMLSFDEGCKLELMRKSDIHGTVHTQQIGLAHFAFHCASRERVIALTEQLRADSFQIVGEPRVTGDNYFESVVADPDGNLIEIIN